MVDLPLPPWDRPIDTTSLTAVAFGFAMANASSHAAGSQRPPEPEGPPPGFPNPGYADSRLKRPREEDLASSAERRMEHVLGKAASPPDSLETQLFILNIQYYNHSVYVCVVIL